MGKNMESIEDTIAQMRKMKSKLPSRPTPDDVNLATRTIDRVDSDMTARLEALFQQASPPGVPYHVFRVYLEMREDLIRAKAQEEKSIAVGVKALEERHQHFDSLIQKAQSATSHPLHNSAVHEGSAYDYKQPAATTPDGSKHKSLPPLSEDTSYSVPLNKTPPTGGRSFKESSPKLKLDSVAIGSSRTKPTQEPPTQGSQPNHDDNAVRQYPPHLMQTIEKAKDDGLEELKLSNMDLEYLPEYLGLLTRLTSLDLSANKLKELPGSICELSNLTFLNIGNNKLTILPATIGCLVNLRILHMEHNKIEELPVTIGLCTQLVELTADFNQLTALPEATGNLTSLRRISIHLNYVRHLPAKLYQLTNLVELKLSFNQIGRIPDSVCQLPRLTRLDVSSNFADLRELPSDIGCVQSLRELNISGNQISMLPISFARLTNLEKLEMDGNPWVVPPLAVVEKGKEAVLQFMIDQETKIIDEPLTKPGLGKRLSSVFKKKNSSSLPYKVKPVNPLNMRA